jgi:hypothetical protein
MRNSWLTNRVFLAVAGAVVVALIGVGIVTKLGVYHFSDGIGLPTIGSSGQKNVQVTGTIVTIDIFKDTFVLKEDSGTSVTVSVNSSTQYGGGAVALGSFNPGQHVQVKGSSNAKGDIQATSVTPQ